MKVSFVWWNTSLSHRGKSLVSGPHKEYVVQKINFLIREGVQFIALGEVSNHDIEMIKEECDLHTYKVINGCRPAGKSAFDSCLIYDSRIFAAVGQGEPIVSERGERVLKVAQKFIFRFSEEAIPIHVFVSHWPSRLSYGSNDPARARLGLRLRNSVDDVFSRFGNDALVVLLGDYNDEPFDVSIAENLWSTRDRELVRKKKRLLYNPFWRSLGHITAVNVLDRSGLLDGGTYFYSNDESSRWRTFDQILFSSTFLEGTGWYLNESLTRPLDIDAYSERVIDRDEKFDHLPVIAVIERSL